MVTLLAYQFPACRDITVIPYIDKPLVSEQREVLVELIQELFVLGRVADEDFYVYLFDR